MAVSALQQENRALTARLADADERMKCVHPSCMHERRRTDASTTNANTRPTMCRS
jgi:hypothetical protein